VGGWVGGWQVALLVAEGMQSVPCAYITYWEGPGLPHTYSKLLCIWVLRSCSSVHYALYVTFRHKGPKAPIQMGRFVRQRPTYT
jgi:hypothetical protein